MTDEDDLPETRKLSRESCIGYTREPKEKCKPIKIHNESGRKDAQDNTKPAMDKLVNEFMLGMGEVLRHGETKYPTGPSGIQNWKLPPLTARDYRAARLRHAFKEGNDNDSGLDHLFHEACCCMMEWWHKNNSKHTCDW